MGLRKVSRAELAQHATSRSCWTSIYGKVYDVTGFLRAHPGGSGLILSIGGRDGTDGYNGAHMAHGESLVAKHLPEEAMIGELDLQGSESAAKATEQVPSGPPPLNSAVNLEDLRQAAKLKMSKQTWDYYESGAETESTLQENILGFQRIFLRPRVLIKASGTQTACNILGQPSSFPVYISGSAMVGMAVPEGECLLMRAAASAGVCYMVPTLSSKPTAEVMGVRARGQPAFFQLYVTPDRKRTEATVRRAEELGFQGLFLTVDVPTPGRREKDMRNSFVDEPPAERQTDDVSRDSGVMGALQTFFDPDLCWDDIAWLASITSMPIVLKGIQTGDDAVLAARHPFVAGIVVSNHGGRQLDYARSSIEVLEEVSQALASEGLTGRMEVFLDGGIRRGTDVFKALALGAKAVGLSRPLLWGAAAYGQAGAEKALEMLRNEFETAMKLMGTKTLCDIGPHCLSIRSALSKL